MLFLDKLFTRKDPQVPVPLVANYIEQAWFAAGYRACVIDYFNSDPEKYGAKRGPEIDLGFALSMPETTGVFRLPTDRTSNLKVERANVITDDDEEG